MGTFVGKQLQVHQVATGVRSKVLKEKNGEPKKYRRRAVKQAYRA